MTPAGLLGYGLALYAGMGLCVAAVFVTTGVDRVLAFLKEKLSDGKTQRGIGQGGEIEGHANGRGGSHKTATKKSEGPAVLSTRPPSLDAQLRMKVVQIWGPAP